MLDFYSMEKGLKALSLVLFSPYGPMDNPNKLIPTVINKCLSGQKLSLTNGEQRLDFTYISDIVDAYEKAIYYLRNSVKNEHELINVGSGKNYSVREIVSEIEGLIGINICKSWDGMSIDSFNVMSDNTKAMKKIGWSPSWNLISGLNKTIHYYMGVSN